LIEGIVLAAGRSRRAGVFKPAHPFGDRPLLLHAVDGLAPWCDRTTVVAGFRHGDVTRLLADRPWVRIVINRNHDDGMFSSIQAGVAATASRTQGLFVLPADCPGVDASVARQLLDAFNLHDRRRPVIPVHGGHGGHPVLLPRAARRAIIAASSGATLRQLVRDLDPIRLPVSEWTVLRDIDTPADIAALTEELNA
jgi:CTP:molybdopterin cytidylyltransferase MocA